MVLPSERRLKRWKSPSTQNTRAHFVVKNPSDVKWSEFGSVEVVAKQLLGEPTSTGRDIH